MNDADARPLLPPELATFFVKELEDEKSSGEACSIDDGFLEGVDDAFKALQVLVEPLLLLADEEGEEEVEVAGPIERLSEFGDESVARIESLGMSSGSLIKARSMT